MGYPAQFQAYREGRGFTREQLAARAECHRNTVMNVESGRPVRFATIIHLMQHLGYPKDSAEVKNLALQWLEAVSGISIGALSVELPASSSRKRVSFETSRQPGLRRSDRELLSYAARNRKVMNALRAIRDLMDDPAPSRAS